jgi:zinc resistance-associated protein
MKPIRKILIIGLVLLFAGSALAFAQGGRGGGGYGGRMMMDECPWYGEGGMRGQGMMRGAGPGWRGNANLTDEQREQWKSERDRFFAETEPLREQIRDRRITLQDELNKPNPDAAEAGRIQKELSRLQDEFDQKALAHKLEVRKILPDDAKQGFGYGRGARR